MILNQYCISRLSQLRNYKVTPIQATIIQRSLIKAVHIRKALYEKLLHIWHLAENNFFKDIASYEKPNSDLTIKAKSLQKIAIIPDTIKLVELRKKIKELANLYSMRMRNYKSRKAMMDDSLLNLSWYSATALNIDLEKPLSPSILNEITIETISALICNLMKKRRTLRLSSRSKK